MNASLETVVFAMVRSRPLHEHTYEWSQWLRDVGSLSRALFADDPAFDQSEFINACLEPKP